MIVKYSSGLFVGKFRGKCLLLVVGLRSNGVSGVSPETKNFAFEVKVILDFENTCPDSLVAKIGSKGSHN